MSSELFVAEPGELAPFLRATLQAERWHQIRAGVAELVALASVPCVLVAGWGGAPGLARATALAIWLGPAALLGVAVGRHRAWSRRRARFDATRVRCEADGAVPAVAGRGRGDDRGGDRAAVDPRRP